MSEELYRRVPPEESILAHVSVNAAVRLSQLRLVADERVWRDDTFLILLNQHTCEITLAGEPEGAQVLGPYPHLVAMYRALLHLVLEWVGESAEFEVQEWLRERDHE